MDSLPDAGWGDGYQGRLRPIGASTFGAEGATITLKSRASDVPGGLAYVEVDLATSYAPGDNFRVVASTQRSAVKDLKMETSGPTEIGRWEVPSTGDVPNFDGKASPLLTIWRRLHIEQDTMAKTEGDKASVHIAAQPGPAVDGKLSISVTAASMVENEYQGGILRAGGKNYKIVGNTALDAGTGTAVVQVEVRADGIAPIANDETITLYQDDWKATGDADPVTIVDTTDTAAMYNYLQESYDRKQNRFADAFIMPQLSTLNRFDSVIPAQTHLPQDGLKERLDPYRGSRHFETDFFWATYVTSAFEGPAERDGDGTGDTLYRGIANSAPGDVAITFLGAILQESFERELEWRPGVTTAHEIGHTLGLAFGVPAGPDGAHRNPPPNANLDESNLMSKGDDVHFLDGTYLDPIDVAFLRSRRKSPGQ